MNDRCPTRHALRFAHMRFRGGLKWFRLCVCLAIVAGCGEGGESRPEPVTISIKLFPARLMEDPSAQLEDGWRVVEFSGGARAGAGTYVVSSDPLLTEWNISALKVANQPDGGTAITARLNAYARRRVSEFTGDPANLKKHLATEIDGRWADIRPLLRKITDRVTLYGFRPEEAERLEQYLATR